MLYVEGEVVQALNPLDTLTVVEVPVDLSCMMVHTLELEPVKLVLDMVDRTVISGGVCGHNGGSTTITAQSGISAQAPGGGGGGSAAGQPSGQYGGRPGGSGGAGGCIKKVMVAQVADKHLVQI